VGYSLCTCKYVEERRKRVTHAHTHSLASPRLTGRGVGRRWARAHNVRVNSPPKFGPKSHRSAGTPSRLLHPVCRHASMIGRAVLQNHHPQRSCTGRGQIKFLESDLRDCSLASSTSSPWFVYLFIERTSRVVAFNANSARPIAVLIRSSSSNNRESRTVPALKLCLTY
jgi:hypothetical protein